MSEETKPTDAAAPPDDTTGTPPEKVEKTFTQADVDRIVQRRLREAKQATPPTGAEPEKVTKREIKSDVDKLREEVERDRARLRFERLAMKSGIDDEETIEDLFALHQMAAPEDSKAWLEKKAVRFAKSATATPNGPADAARPPAAAPSAPAKVDPLTSGGLVDVFNLSAAQIDQLGPAGLREHFEKALAVGNTMAGAPPRPKVGQRK